MTQTTEEFFRTLQRHGNEPMLSGVNATIRFDITGAEHLRSWWLEVRDGDLLASTDGSAADCVLTADQGVFDRIVSGSMNAMAALLRGDLAVWGDPELVVLVQRLFPGPARVDGARTVDAGEGRST